MISHNAQPSPQIHHPVILKEPQATEGSQGILRCAQDDIGVNVGQHHPQFSKYAERTRQTSWKINNLSFTSYTGRIAAPEKSRQTNYWTYPKNRQNELSKFRFRKIEQRVPQPSTPFTRNDPLFYAMKKEAIRLRIIHRFTHRFSSCPPAAR